MCTPKTYSTCGFLSLGRKEGTCPEPAYTCNGVLGFLGIGSQVDCPAVDVPTTVTDVPTTVDVPPLSVTNTDAK